MSTRSYICIKLNEEDKKNLNTKDEYLGVYCHYDGYIRDGVGEMLHKHYGTPFKARRLVLKNRNMSTLGEFIKNSRFYKPTKQCDEKGVTFNASDLKDAENFMMIRFIYIFQHSRWEVFEVHGRSWRNIGTLDSLLKIKP